MDLSANQIEQIPSDLSKCTALNSLQLANNRLRRIPAALKGLPNLRVVNFGNNPLEIPIEKQLSLITTAPKIRGYLLDLDEGFRLWPECKVLILGQEVCFTLLF